MQLVQHMSAMRPPKCLEAMINFTHVRKSHYQQISCIFFNTKFLIKNFLDNGHAILYMCCLPQLQQHKYESKVQNLRVEVLSKLYLGLASLLFQSSLPGVAIGICTPCVHNYDVILKLLSQSEWWSIHRTLPRVFCPWYLPLLGAKTYQPQDFKLRCGNCTLGIYGQPNS